MKVLLVYGDVGGGHAAPAKALKEAFHDVYGNEFEVEAVDLYKIADPAPWGNSETAHTIFSQNRLLRRVSDFFNVLTDSRIGHHLFRYVILKRTLEPYRAFFEQAKPNLIVSIHPLTTVTLSRLRQQGRHIPYAIVITDLARVQRGWADPNADLTISPTDEVTAALERFGVPGAQIISPFFPIRSSLLTIASKEQVFARHHLDPHRTTLVITGGGVGTRSLENAITLLAKKEFQLILICGKDKVVAEKLRRKYQRHPSVVILDFVKDIQNYYKHGDVIVTKAGTNSLLEIELFEKRAIITHEIGFQEQGNAAYALKNPRFRYLAGDMKKLIPTLEKLLTLSVKDFTPPRRTSKESLEIVKQLVKLVGK